MKTKKMMRLALAILLAFTFIAASAMQIAADSICTREVKYFAYQGSGYGSSVYRGYSGLEYGSEYTVLPNMFTAPKKNTPYFLCWSRMGSGNISRSLLDAGITAEVIPGYSTALDYFAPGETVVMNNSYTFWAVWTCTREVRYYIYDCNFAKANGLDPWAMYYSAGGYRDASLPINMTYTIKDNMFGTPKKTNGKSSALEFVCWSRAGSGNIYGDISKEDIPNYSTKLDYYAPGETVRLNQSYTFYGIWNCKREVKYYANNGGSNYDPANYRYIEDWYGKEHVILDNVFDGNGAEFVCWSRIGSGKIYGDIAAEDIPNYSKSLDYYAPGETVTLNGTSYTFYAVWKD